MKKFLKNNYKLCIVSLLIAIFLAFYVSKLLFPNYQFAISSDSENDFISIGTSDDVKKEMKDDNGVYSINLSKKYTGKKLNISYEKKKNKIKEVVINNKIIKTYKLNTYAITDYDKVTLFDLQREDNMFLYCFIFLFLVLFALFVCIFNNGKYKILKINIISKIGKKHIIISSIIILLSIFFVCGCDVKVIVNCTRWFTDGVDIYQFQINSRNLFATEYAQFPYNPISILSYGEIFKIFSLIFKNLPLIKGYPYFQTFIVKCINLILIQATVLQVLNYLYNHNKIKTSRLKLIYYLSIFNPVSFYVAFLFVQLDPLSLFLITTGFLMLEKIKDNNYIGVLFISFGLVIKTQLLVVFPIIVLSIIIYSFHNEKFKNGMKKLFYSGLILSTIILIFHLSYTLLGSSFHLLNSKLVQAQRIYFAVINYMGQSSIFISIFFVGLVVFSYAFNLRLNIKNTNLTKTNLIYLMILIFTLSATIVPTPSIYVLSLPAFIIFIYDEDDLFRILLITFLSFGIIMLPMLSDYGDITVLLSGFDKRSILMSFISKLNQNDYIKFYNILLTISSVSMVAYNIYGLQVSKKYMEVINEKI